MRQLGAVIDVDGRAQLVTGAKVEATITRSVDGIASDVSMTLYALPDEVVQSVLAGKTVKAQVLVDGEIATTFDMVTADYKAASHALMIRGGEAALLYNEALVSLAFQRTAPVAEVVRGVASAVGLPVIMPNSPVVKSDQRVFSCLWRDAMTRLLGDGWTVTSSGVVIGGMASSVNLTPQNVHQWTGWSRSRTRDGKDRRVLSCIAPYTQVDVGAECGYDNGHMSGKGAVWSLTHSLSDAEQVTKLQILT